MGEKNNDIMYLNKHNTMVKARYHLNASELRLYLFILFRLQKESESDGDRIKKYEDYVSISIPKKKFLKVVSSEQYIENQKLNKTLEELRRKPVYYEVEKKNGNKDWSMFGFILKYSYKSEDDSYVILIDSIIYDMVVKYKSFGYTHLNLALIFSLSGVYSYRIYELLKLWGNSKSVINYKISDIKEYLMLDKKKSYDKYSNFKNKIILPAITELNNSGMFEINMEEVKIGKKIDSINFITKSTNSKSRIITDKEKESMNTIYKNKFYIPSRRMFTSKILKMIEDDFREFDLKDNEITFLEVASITIDKTNSNKVNNRNYNYFKKVLSDKLKEGKNIQDEFKYKKTKFHNFDESFTQYTPEELDEIIEKSQREKYK